MLSGGETRLGLQRVDPRAPVGFGPPPELGGTGDPIIYAGRCLAFWDARDTSERRLQISDVSVNGRLLRWPPFAKGSLFGSWIGFAAHPDYGSCYRALEGDATIPVNRLTSVRP
jgi:hypothetical protein